EQRLSSPVPGRRPRIAAGRAGADAQLFLAQGARNLARLAARVAVSRRGTVRVRAKLALAARLLRLGITGRTGIDPGGDGAGGAAHAGVGPCALWRLVPGPEPPRGHSALPAH